MMREISVCLLGVCLFLLNSSSVEAQVTPESKINTLDQFSVELVYKVPMETEGSWVAISRMRDGRLVVSDQGSRGIHLVEVDPEPGPPKVTVKKIDLDISAAQGLMDTENGLYVNMHNKGMFLLKDDDGDGQFEAMETLSQYPGGGEHGQHAIVLDRGGKTLWVESGNHTALPEYTGTRTGGDWQEDLLLPRQWDARGHARGKLAPGGWITEYDMEKREHSVHSIGYRNSYDLDQNEFGDLFTYDADMEWDFGMPWYRPTRICHAVSGSEFGWRSGTGKWPTYFEDSLPPVVDIGPASPTGVVFGKGAKFPAKYQRALFALDWTYGIIYAIHLTPAGATYTGEPEIFVSGKLPVTDAVVGADGMLYFTTGGRGIESALYRIRYNGTESVEPYTTMLMDEASDNAYTTRKMLERFHGSENPGAIEPALEHLGSEDRFVRFAARIALESQPVQSWRDKVLSLPDSQAMITGAVALARCGSNADQAPLLKELDKLNISELSEGQQLGLMRAYALTFIRLGVPTEEYSKALRAKLLGLFPSQSADMNTELIRMLVYLKEPGVIGPALDLIRNRGPAEPPEYADIARRNDQYGKIILKMMDNHPPSREIGFAFMLRNLRDGWSMDQRKTYLEFLAEAAKATGGESYTGFLANLRDEFLGNCRNDELAQLTEFSGVSFKAEPDFEINPPQGPGQKWTVEEAQAIVRGGNLKNASFENGRSLFHSANCAQCHRFDGLGGDVGPDLTSVKNKFSSDYVAAATVNPSLNISDQYAASKVLLEDGTLHVGLIAEGPEGSLKIYPASDDGTITEVVVSKDEIENIAPSQVSQMPEGLLDNLNNEEIRDLVAYIMSAGDEGAKVYGNK